MRLYDRGPHRKAGNMATIQGSVDIAAPRQAVWDVMSDVSRYSELGSFTDEAVMVSDGKLGEGSVYSETGKIAGMKYNSEWTVTEFDPVSRQVHVGVESSMRIEVTWDLVEIDAENTKAFQVVELTMMPKFRPLGVLLEKLFVTRMMTKALVDLRENLKRIAEAEKDSN